MIAFQKYVAATLAPPLQTFHMARFRIPGSRSKLNSMLFELQDLLAGLYPASTIEYDQKCFSFVTKLFRYFFSVWETLSFAQVMEIASANIARLSICRWVCEVGLFFSCH